MLAIAADAVAVTTGELDDFFIGQTYVARALESFNGVVEEKALLMELVYDFVLPLREVFGIERIFVKVVIHKELGIG